MRTLANGLVAFFTSLRLTVTLLAFAILLVFVGTLAQVDEGLYNAQERYFRQWFILGLTVSGHRIPLLLPGGYFIGTMLLLNLVAAHIYRFQLSVKKIGIQIIHSGVILLLVGQLATDMLAHESQIHFIEGEAKPYAESSHASELAFVTDDGADHERVIAIPDRLLARGGNIQNKNLPFTVRVKSFWPNSEPTFRAPMMKNGPPLTTNGLGHSFDFQAASEVKSMDETNVPTAIIEIIGPGGSLGDWVVSDWATMGQMVEAMQMGYSRQLGPQMAQKVIAQLTQAQTVTINDTKFTFALRPERVYFPFSMKLLKATHTVYPGTDIPKDFRSHVQLHSDTTGEDREVEISMNHPLRYAGLTFYQYQMDAGQTAREAGRTPSSVLQVVRNPGWLTPYIGCGLVATGLIVQFLFHLVGFLSKRKMK